MTIERRLSDFAQLVRSKNAGPFLLTLDIMFDDADDYQAFAESGVVTPAVISRLYGVPEDVVRIVKYDQGLGLKVTIPRRVVSGSPFDDDVYGAQQHAPLASLLVPVGTPRGGDGPSATAATVKARD